MQEHSMICEINRKDREKKKNKEDRKRVSVRKIERCISKEIADKVKGIERNRVKGRVKSS